MWWNGVTGILTRCLDSDPQNLRDCLSQNDVATTLIRKDGFPFSGVPVVLADDPLRHFENYVWRSAVLADTMAERAMWAMVRDPSAARGHEAGHARCALVNQDT